LISYRLIIGEYSAKKLFFPRLAKKLKKKISPYFSLSEVENCPKLQFFWEKIVKISIFWGKIVKIEKKQGKKYQNLHFLGLEVPPLLVFCRIFTYDAHSFISFDV